MAHPSTITKLNNPRTGLRYWFLTCFFGSIAAVEFMLIVDFQTTSIQVLITDGLIYGLGATLIAMVLSSPFILMIYLLAGRNLKLNLVVYGNLVFSMLLIFFFTLTIEPSINATLALVLPYYLFGFFYGYLFLKKESIAKTHKYPSEELLNR